MSVSSKDKGSTPTTEATATKDSTVSKEILNSPTKRAKMSTKLSHSTSIQFDISNKTALSDLSTRYNPPTLPSEPVPPPPQKVNLL